MFTKIDLQWEYNNVRIKKGDEYKAVFSMPEGAFEPMVMLTNSPAMFQVIINDLIRDTIRL